MFKITEMKNSQAFHISFLTLAFQGFVLSVQLDDFMKAFEDANLELDLIRQKRSPSIEELLSRFGEDDDQLENSNLEAGDAWYQSFRAMECLHGGCSKRPLRWKTKNSQTDEDYEYYEEEDEEPSLQDQWESTQNDLSHEANYKLSKLEQDAVEKSLPKTAWPVRHQNKRHVDPMQAIKLKTSLRMLKNGDGATLPSSFLGDDRQKISVEDILASSKHDESPDPWKETYEVVESRKLLSVDDSEDPPILGGKVCRSKDCLNNFPNVDQFDNMNQKTDLDKKFAGIYFDNTDVKRVSSKKGALATLSDELMHSEAFVKLQNFIKGTNESGLNKTKSEPKTTTTTSRPKPSVPLNLVDKDRDVNIKLHMSVNATVLGDAKLPEQFHKNNTLTFKAPTIRNKTNKKGRSMAYKERNLDRNRDRRGVVFPILTSSSKRKANEEISKSVIEDSDNFPLDEILTGKLTSQLVHTIFSLVKSSPNLKVLWPGLKKNKVTSPKQVQNFYAIRTQDNESEMHRTELMLRQAMDTINAIIEQQVRSRSCVPLRADLKDFYNLILTTQAENNQLQDRQKRETSSDEVNSMDDTQIRQKSRVVKKLLQDYEALPPEDQDQVANIKESLLFVAEELRELEQKSRRKKRQLMASHLLNQNASLFQSPSDLQYSPQYLKLARTAEMLLHNSVKDSDLTIDFNSI